MSARLGVFDLCRDYGVPEPLVKTMGRATQLAVAAGLECMKDAGLIPSVDGQLPEHLRGDTYHLRDVVPGPRCRHRRDLEVRRS